MDTPRRTPRAPQRPVTSRRDGVSSRGSQSTVPASDTPTRQCVGCGKREASVDLVRLVLDESVAAPGAGVVVDARGGDFGRGAHVHPNPTCLEAACKKGLARAFRQEIKADSTSLGAMIREAFERRIVGLISGGLRGGHVVFGSDVVAEACRAGGVALVVLAADAASAAKRSEVVRATAMGKTLVFGDKRMLATAVGRGTDPARDGVGVVAITTAPLASAVRRAWLAVAGVSAKSHDRHDASSSARGQVESSVEGGSSEGPRGLELQPESSDGADPTGRSSLTTETGVASRQPPEQSQVTARVDGLDDEATDASAVSSSAPADRDGRASEGG